MGKLLLYGFIGSLVVLALYLASFIVYLLLAIRDIFVDLGVSFTLPFERALLSFQYLASEFFFILFPVIAILGFSGLILLSKVRQPTGLRLKYAPISEPRICVALTAYNDETPIYEAVKDFKSQRGVQEVIVVDNNSVDNTALRAREAGARVVREEKQGYGYACMRGLRETLLNKNANVITLAEGDRTFRAYDMKKLIPYLDNADLVLGTRTTQELLDQKSQLDWFYVWGNLFLAKLIQLKYWSVKCWGKVRLTDVGCTFRAIRPEALSKIIDQLDVGGDHFSPHMILTALENDLKVVEVPVTFRERVGESKGAGSNKRKAIKVGLQMLWHILTYQRTEFV